MRTVVAGRLSNWTPCSPRHTLRAEWRRRANGQWEQSEKSFRRAIELEPNRPLTRLDYASSLLMPLGWIDEAIAQDRIAEKNDLLGP